MNVLITGGGGFIGSHLVDSQLKKGYHVRSVDLHVERLSHVKDHSNLEIIIGDITDDVLINQVIKEIDIVYHLAAAHLDINLTKSYCTILA